MDKRILTAISGCGSLISLSSLIVFFKNENYAIVVVLVFFTILFTGVAIRTVLIPKLKYHKTIYDIKIIDFNGEKAICTKETLMEAKQKNINTVTDRNFAATGSIKFTETNIGKIHGPFKEGGTNIIKTILNTPLKLGKKVKKVLTFEVNGGFTEAKESLDIQIDHFSNLFTMRIHAPDGKPFKNVESFLYYNHKSQSMNGYTEISKNDYEILFEYTNVKSGH